MTEHHVKPIMFNLKKLSITMIILLLTTLVHYYINNGYNMSLEMEKCPFCYGVNLCQIFKNNEISFNNLSYSEMILNLINAKNVYVANYDKKKVILKKLGHTWELNNIDKTICEAKNYTKECPPFHGCNEIDYTNDILHFLANDDDTIFLNLKMCSLSAVNQFVNVIFAQHSHLNLSVMTANIWTTLLANAEPLLLQILNEKDGWPVPKYYGACGRLIVEEYCGQTLNALSEDHWRRRAIIALELLTAAELFTYNHPLFRFYLSDISPDNIAVTAENKIKFIDLENVIVTEKKTNFDDSRLHESKHFDCENCYAFSAEEICSHSISDHNFYSVCKLLLSKNAPWPMMTNGLLHSPPKYVSQKYPELLNLVEICAESSQELNRFKSAKLLIKSFKHVLEDEHLINYKEEDEHIHIDT